MSPDNDEAAPGDGDEHHNGVCGSPQPHQTPEPRQMPDVDQDGPDHNIIPGGWRANNPLLDGIDNIRGNRDTRAAKAQRQYLTAYVNSPAGAVPWQHLMI